MVGWVGRLEYGSVDELGDGNIGMVCPVPLLLSWAGLERDLMLDPMLMILGKLVLPTSPRAKPDGKIHGAAKRKWVLVDPSTVPQGVIEELKQAIAADREAAIALAS